MNELRPCPFCGSKPKMLADFPHVQLTTVSCKNKECKVHPYTVGLNINDATERWNHRPRLENKPLTLDQLRQMDGEPVWVVHPNMKGWFEYDKEQGWYILEHFFGGGMGIKDSKMNTALSKESDYGRNWLAYARKLEQEASSC